MQKNCHWCLINMKHGRTAWMMQDTKFYVLEIKFATSKDLDHEKGSLMGAQTDKHKGKTIQVFYPASVRIVTGVRILLPPSN